MNLRYSMTTTTWIIIASIFVWIVWDIVAYTSHGKFSTISEVITEWSFYSPSAVLGIGIVVGHWFWPVYVKKD